MAVDILFDTGKRARPAEGVDAVYLPGDIELRCRAERERDGIPVADQTWEAIQREAANLNVAL